jgi:hypothetical protein
MKEVTNRQRFEFRLFDTDKTKIRINELILNKKYTKEVLEYTDDDINFLQRIYRHITNNLNKRKIANEETEEETSESAEPDKYLEAGKVLPKFFSRKLPNDFVGKPLEEIDEYYKSHHVCL